MSYTATNFAEKCLKFNDQWSTKIVGQMNDYHFKLVRTEGEFVWHSHADTDKVFIVLDGVMKIRFRDGEVSLRSGEMFIIPRGLEHSTFAESECKIMLVERAGTINTGDTESDLTAQDDQWI